MKSAFITTLTKLMSAHDDIVTITADMGFSVFEDLQKKFPQRFINTGVAEQASMSVAAGFALSGFRVFFYAQAAFATMRCFEQVRLDAAYNALNIKIIGVNAGFSLNQLGVSHFSLEDVAIMRTLPGMTIFSPANPHEMQWALQESYRIEGPTYLRYSKLNDTNDSYKISLGKPVQLTQGKETALLVSGGILSAAKDVVNKLQKKDIHLSLYSVPTIKPLDKDVLYTIAEKSNVLFTLEEHSRIGGLGSAVLEMVSEFPVKTRVHRIGVPDKFTSVTGSIDYLLAYNGLSADIIEKTIITLLQQ
jgi:transketolase